MKKSKIIAPALAVLTLSTAAAVTGTVAWFTAGRIKNVAMTGISAINPESGLNLTVTNKQHTTVTGNDTDNNWSVAHSLLRDGSVDVTNGNAYGSILSDSGDVVGYKAAGTLAGGYSAGTAGGQAIYYATAFQCAFTLSNESSYPYNLFFNINGSRADAGTAADRDTTIMNALRIGVAVSSSVYWVWAPNTQDTTVKYVSGEVAAPANAEQLAAKETDYSTHAVKGAGEALPATEIVNNTTAQATTGYLGELDDETALNVTVYTWFEGLDSDCLNSAKDLESAFTANLAFKMIRSA